MQAMTLQETEDKLHTIITYLQDAKLAPKQIISEAHKHLMLEVPVYTGTYRDAIHLTIGGTEDGKIQGAQVRVNAYDLEYAAGQHAGASEDSDGKTKKGATEQVDEVLAKGGSIQGYLYGEPFWPSLLDDEEDDDSRTNISGPSRYMLKHVNEPYIYRIEREGAPISGMGQGMWRQAAAIAFARYDGHVKWLKRTLGGS